MYACSKCLYQDIFFSIMWHNLCAFMNKWPLFVDVFKCFIHMWNIIGQKCQCHVQAWIKRFMEKKNMSIQNCCFSTGNVSSAWEDPRIFCSTPTFPILSRGICIQAKCCYARLPALAAPTSLSAHFIFIHIFIHISLVSEIWTIYTCCCTWQIYTYL